MTSRIMILVDLFMAMAAARTRPRRVKRVESDEYEGLTHVVARRTSIVSPVIGRRTEEKKRRERRWKL
jgi:hypothetical protein